MAREKGDARATVEIHLEEERAVRALLAKSDGNVLTVRDLREQLHSHKHFKAPNEAVYRKRLQRALTRMEEQSLIARLDARYQEIDEGKTYAVRLQGNMAPLADLAVELGGKGVGKAAVAVVMALAEKTLRRQLPSAYIERLDPLFRYAREEVVKISESGAGPERTSWDVRALVDSVYLAQKGIVQLPLDNRAEQVADQVYQAIGRGKRITFDYHGKRRKGRQSFVCGALGVAFRSPKIYLVGEDLSETRKHTYRVWSLDRIEDLEILRLPYSRPRDFSLADYVEKEAHLESAWNPERPDPVSMSFRVYPHPLPGHGEGLITDEFEEMRLEGLIEQKRHRDGSITIRLQRRDTIEFRRWLMGYGEAVKVLSGLPGFEQTGTNK